MAPRIVFVALIPPVGRAKIKLKNPFSPIRQIDMYRTSSRLNLRFRRPCAGPVYLVGLCSNARRNASHTTQIVRLPPGKHEVQITTDQQYICPEIINTSYQKLPFGSGDYPDKLLYHQALN